MQPTSRAEIWDLLLPIAVVGTVGMMVFPMPLWMLDFLLMCNIAFALGLLITSVYLSEPERFTSLPSILLLATLFRLGLNISTTRQILAVGDAPATIMTFGNFVVRGNLVVGVVVFLIITLVQFLVVAKGAERVAEVAARFSLDGMPGKQMSIDADIRAGVIGLVEAREKRIALQRESRLYGSLDGAMKFVKGDAIAGLLITGINISAGLLLGVTQHQLSIVQAAEKFTLFTIGDGLVSQIPALLVAVAAGIAVTRVSDEQQTFLGRDVLSQLTNEPQAVATTAVVLGLLGTVPGLPGISFWTMAFCLLTSAMYFQRQRAAEQKRVTQSEFRPQLLSNLVLRLSAAATARLQEEQQLPDMVFRLRGEFFEDTGLVFPEIQFDIVDSREQLYIELAFQGVVVFSIAEEDFADDVEEAASKKVLIHLKQFLYKQKAEMLSDSQTRILLELHRPTCEDLINSVVPELLSVTQLTTLLRQLVSEEVSIRAMHSILQSIAEHSLTENSNPASLLASVRVGLATTITESVVRRDGTVVTWVLSAGLDSIFAKNTTAGLPVDPMLIKKVVAELGTQQNECEQAVLITSRHARELVSRYLRQEDLNVRVIAADELEREVKIEILGELDYESAVEGSSLEPTIDRLRAFDQPAAAAIANTALGATAH